ncbi:type VII secretion target [Aeromicrobium sp. NPDC092404]|uniref:type VII secretion target n=1 Tax=Aeromicrobium sp. NPDC092404 TaxID=3154976 RepID=UPI0034477136
MTGGLEVWLDSLRTAGAEWDDQAEELRKARRALHDGSSSVDELGSRVAPAAEVFLDAWITGLAARVDEAAEHATALTDAAATYAATDAARSAELANLLAWDDRNLRPER